MDTVSAEFDSVDLSAVVTDGLADGESPSESCLPVHLREGTGKSPSDFKLATRAIRGKWGVSRRRKAPIVDAAYEMAMDTTARPAARLAAMRFLLEADRMDIKRIEVALAATRPGSQHTVINVTGDAQIAALPPDALEQLAKTREILRNRAE